MKEYNISLHYDSHHSDKFRNLQGKAMMDKVKELSSLRKQQSSFCQSMEVSNAAVRSSYHIAKEIAVASKTFSDGEFAKN